MDSELEQASAQQANRDRRAGAAAVRVLEALGYTYVDREDAWLVPCDIPAGEAQTISPGDVGHASSLFGPIGN